MAGKQLEASGETYRTSNRVKAFLPVTELNGLNDDSIVREWGDMLDWTRTDGAELDIIYYRHTAVQNDQVQVDR